LEYRFGVEYVVEEGGDDELISATILVPRRRCFGSGAPRAKRPALRKWDHVKRIPWFWHKKTTASLACGVSMATMAQKNM
jgi:hypothetical protein